MGFTIKIKVFLLYTVMWPVKQEGIEDITNVWCLRESTGKDW